MDSLEFLGNPVQARVVPEAVERLVASQVAMVDAIHRYLAGAVNQQSDIEYYRYLAEADGMPAYGVVVHMRGRLKGEVPAETLRKPLERVLGRFGKRANLTTLLAHPEAGGWTSLVAEWCLKVDGTMLGVFEAQELPTFGSHPTGLCRVDFHLAEPIFPYDLHLLRARAEGCGAAAVLDVFKGTHSGGIRAVVPADIPFPGAAKTPSEERMAYLREQMRPWSVVAEKVSDDVSPAKGAAPGEAELSFERADETFTALAVCAAAGGRALRASPKGVTLAGCREVLGEPTKEIIYEDGLPGWVYAVRMGNALAVVEGANDLAMNALLVGGGERPPIIQFDRLVSLLRG